MLFLLTHDERGLKCTNWKGVTPAKQKWMLAVSTLAFTVCFAVRTIFSIIGVRIKQDLGWNDAALLSVS